MRRERLSIAETFGLSPAKLRWQEAMLAIRGQNEIPATRWGLSSVTIFRPWISFPAWLGKTRSDRRIPIYNFFNHNQTDPADGWSVRVTQPRDFTGGFRTYDSHNGTDFVIPPGTTVCAPADGRVMLVPNEFNRGGLKVIIDHGHGIVSSSNHLGRALVEVGEEVERGQPIALSGYSGIDGFLFFPWSAPHVHFNVFLDGKHVDPFPSNGEIGMWQGGGDPLPPTESELAFTPSRWNSEAMAETIAACRNQEVQSRLSSIDDEDLLAAELLYQVATYPTRFSSRPNLYKDTHQRRELLSLPFLPEEFIGVHY